MRKILSIAILTLRGTVRSKLFATLVVTVLLAVIALPLTIRGDGTAEGYTQVALLYTLRVVEFLLAAATIWTANRIVSMEIEEKQIHLLVTKPVRCIHIWLGKWLGLSAMNAVVLTIAATVTYGVLEFGLWQSSFDAGLPAEYVHEETLSAKRMLMPETDDNHGNRIRLKPAETWRWTFPADQQIADGQDVRIRFAISSPIQLELKPVRFKWCSVSAGNAFEYEDLLFAGQSHSFTIPSDKITPGVPLALEFTNLQDDPPADILFNQDAPVIGLVKAGSFEGNFFRAMIIVLCKLTMLSALGITTGLAFSMPVATFVSYAVVIFFMSSGFIHRVATATDVQQYRPMRHFAQMDSYLIAQFRLFNAVVDPVRRLDAVDKLPRGELISWRYVGRSMVVTLLMYSLALALVGTALFSRRELGLPPE